MIPCIKVDSIHFTFAHKHSDPFLAERRATPKCIPGTTQPDSAPKRLLQQLSPAARPILVDESILELVRALLAGLLGCLFLLLLPLLLLLESLLLLAAEAGELAVGTTEDKAGVHHVEEYKRKEDWECVEAEGVALVSEEVVVLIDTRAKLDETIDDSDLEFVNPCFVSTTRGTYDDEDQDKQHGPDEPLHPTNVATLNLPELIVEESSQAAKDDDYAQLDADTCHVDLLSDPNQVLVLVVGEQTSAAALNDEQDDVDPDEKYCHSDGLDA